MPTVIERRKATQRRALAKQRARIRRFREQRKALARTRAAIRKTRSKIGKRRRLIRQLEADLKASPVRIVGNRAHGGTPRQRLEAVAKAAVVAHMTGRRRSFYSQAGAWTVEYAITGEPRGYRSDCSQWVTSVYWSAGLPDPNGNGYRGGYTGTLATHGVRTRDEEAGDLGMYGVPPYFHVEMRLGEDGPQFAGHGSPPVDYLAPGWPDEFYTYLKG
jgi:hypothetical protein